MRSLVSSPLAPTRVGPLVVLARARRARRAALALTLCVAASVSGAARRAGAQAPPPAPGGAVPTFVTLNGVVRARNGATPVAGAEVSMRVGQLVRRTTTSDDGTFTLPNIPEGPVRLVVRRIGFKPDSFPAAAPGDGRLALTLEPIAQKLQAVVVQSRRRGPYTGPHADFLRRLDNGNGRFVTRDQIVKRNAMRTTDLLRSVPGVWMTSSRSGMTVPRFRASQCDPLIWVDGAPAYAGYFDVDAISPETLEGMEIYSGVASTPMELRGRNGEERCGVIALWTRMPVRAKRDRGKRITPDELAALVASASLFTAEQVDVAARPDTASPVVPIYPDSLKRANVGGVAVVEFVVDAEGEVEAETIGLVTATHPLFAGAAREAVARAGFVPAQRQGRAVRQLVQLAVEFEANRR
jgi:TonB family protein